MAQFSYADYQNVVSKAQTPSSSSVKVGFFKLAKDGDEALVRINCASIEDLKFATVHAPVFGKKYEGLGSGYTPVMCLNEVGDYSEKCPFCRAAAAGHDVIGKASKKVYVEMLVAYKDAATGAFSAAIPVVWERPAGFSSEIASKLRDYGNLRETVFKVTRVGTGKDTRYSLDFIPLYNKPEAVSTDFSAFSNFDITKHSFWVKTAEELEDYLTAGSFPVSEIKPAEESKNLNKVFATPAEEKKAEEALGFKPEPTPAPAVEPAPAPTPAVAPAAAPAAEAERPVRTFNKFSF
jgi:hypothetical protein